MHLGVDADYRWGVVPIGDLAQRVEAAGLESLMLMQGTHVTVASADLDESKLERCAESGVDRCVIALAPRDQNTVDDFLEKCAPLAARYA